MLMRNTIGPEVWGRARMNLEGPEWNNFFWKEEDLRVVDIEGRHECDENAGQHD